MGTNYYFSISPVAAPQKSLGETSAATAHRQVLQIIAIFPVQVITRQHLTTHHGVQLAPIPNIDDVFHKSLGVIGIYIDL